MFNLKKLPNSSNLQVLYISYMSIYALFVLYPLAFIFSFLLTINSMIKFNELVSFYSLGFKPSKLLKPFVFFSIFFTFLMFMLQSTKLAYSNEFAQALKSNSSLKTNDIFLKHKNYIIYIKELKPLLKKAKELTVFEIDKDLKRVIFANEAFFVNDKWCSKGAEILTISKERWKKEKKEVCLLENFKPKILSNLKTLNSISFIDAYMVIKYFKDIDKNRILAIVFYKLFTPLLLIVVMIYLFFNSPIHLRVSNVKLFFVFAIALGVGSWGVELLIFKFAKQGVLPYWVIAIPFVLSILLFLRRDNV